MYSWTAAAARTVAVTHTRRLLIVGLMAAAFAMVGCEEVLTPSDLAVPQQQAATSSQDETAAPIANSNDIAADPSAAAMNNNETVSPANTPNDSAITNTTTSEANTVTNTSTAENTSTTTTTGSNTGTSQQATTGNIWLSWRAPTERENGEALALAELSGYRIYYGPATNPRASNVAVNDPLTTTLQIDGISPGTYQVAISAIDKSGFESELSNSLSKTIQ